MDSSGKEQEEGIVSPREWFNRNAKSYDDALSSTLALAENEVLFNWVGQSINSQTTVFDAGCGTGGILQSLKDTDFINEASGCEPHDWAYK